MTEPLNALYTFFILPGLATLIGGWWIHNALWAFRRQKYFVCGLYSMLVLHEAFIMLEVILES